MDDVVAQLPFSVRCFSFPRLPLTLQLQSKECCIIRSGCDAVDYTGLRVAWPGAHLLLRFLLHFRSQLSALSTCELGSGSGLCGLLCAHLSSHCALTDRVPAVLDLLHLNVQSNLLSHKAAVHSLDWGTADAQTLLQALPPPHLIHCVIAADIIYPDTTDCTIHRLLDTVVTLLHPCPPSSSSSSPFHRSFVLSYVNRSSSTSRRFFDIAAARGFHCTQVPVGEFGEEEERREGSGEEGERTLEQEMQGLMGYAVLIFRPDGTTEWRSTEPFLSMTAAEDLYTKLSAAIALDDESTALPFFLDGD